MGMEIPSVVETEIHLTGLMCSVLPFLEIIWGSTLRRAVVLGIKIESHLSVFCSAFSFKFKDP
jgi:hypothetical protein